MQQEYIDFGVFDPDEVLPFAIDPQLVRERGRIRQGLSKEEKRREYTADDGGKHFVKMTSQRYWVFKSNRSCVVCGRVGTIMVLQQDCGNRTGQRGADGTISLPTSRLHFNMFAVEPDGTRVLMTKDHILPSAKGGRDRIDNYQTMCTICNGIKGDRIMTPKEVREFGRIRNPNE